MLEPTLSASSKKFLTALISATSTRPISLQLSELYDLENDLRRKFAAKESVPDPSSNLVPAFHSKVSSMGGTSNELRSIE